MLTVVAIAGCQRRVEVDETTWMTMGTFATLSVAGSDAATADALAARTRTVFDTLNHELSTYLPDSEISRLNQAGTNTVALGAEALTMVAMSRAFCAQSGGAFDPTVMPLVRLWGFSGGTPPDALPSAEAIAAARARIGMTHLHVIDGGAHFDRPDMSLDLGGIAKGYAVDRAFDALTQTAAPALLINLGGNMRCYGQRDRKRHWRIGVRNPFDHNDIVGVLDLPPGMATATSGNYERFVTINDHRYSHIIDPVAGRPVEGMAGVSILSPTAVEADALSTALFILGIEAGAKLVAQRPSCGAVFVPDRQPVELWVTPRFAERFTPDPRFAKRVHGIE